VIILLGPEPEWESIWKATRQEVERAPGEKRPVSRLEKNDGDLWPWDGNKEWSFHEYDVFQKTKNQEGKVREINPVPKNWFNDRLKDFRFPESVDQSGRDQVVTWWSVAEGPGGLNAYRSLRFEGTNTFAFFLKKCVFYSTISSMLIISLSRDPTSVKTFADILRNDYFHTVGTNRNREPIVKKDPIRMMRFVVGVDYPFINRTEEPSTGNPMFDFSKKRREEILKTLQKDLGVEVMQYVGRIIALTK
jgi:hypothetical protein